MIWLHNLHATIYNIWIDNLTIELLFFSDHIAKQSYIYSYTKSFNAFAANLLPQEIQRLQGVH